MNKEELKDVLLDQAESFNRIKEYTKREIDLTTYMSTSLVVVISGVRRCGKSTLLYAIKEEMKLKEGEYLYFNFDDERITPNILIFTQIYDLFKELYDTEPVFFFDEIQHIEGWEKFVNRMYEKGLKVFVTGSNAKLLSSEISTSLTGRNKVIKLFPFSFREYLVFVDEKYNLNKLSPSVKNKIKKRFNFYFQKGGFPLVDKENDLEIINSYFQDILYRDIIVRHKITQVQEIKAMGLYLMSNIAKLFSYATLKNVSGIKSLNSVKSYLEYYHQSFIFFYLKKFDYSVKKQIMNSRKVYVIDQAFASRIGSHFSENKGRILENIVYLELKRNNNEIFYHSNKKECDFLVRDGVTITEAIQVCYSLHSDNEKREYAGLLEAIKTYELKDGTILTMDQEKELEIDGHLIKVTPVWQWLLNRA